MIATAITTKNIISLNEIQVSLTIETDRTILKQNDLTDFSFPTTGVLNIK
jgi:hypothetical protein